ncbi:hypothetical protein KQI84_13370 [bacterium]|nr:hypothetical protein [bacterium]
MKRRIGILIGFLILAALAAASWHRASYEVTHFAIANGGTTISTGAEFTLGATTGQVEASGPMTSGGYELCGGFWHQSGGGPPAGPYAGWTVR